MAEVVRRGRVGGGRAPAPDLRSTGSHEDLSVSFLKPVLLFTEPDSSATKHSSGDSVRFAFDKFKGKVNSFIKNMQRIILDVDACTLCGQCVHTCPLSILVIQNNKISLHDPHRCFQCLQCMQICPEDCFSFPPVYEVDTDTQNKS